MPRTPRPAPVGLSGLILGGAGLFLLFFALVEGERIGWGSPAIMGCFVAAAVLLTWFIINERTSRKPLLDPGLFTDRLFVIGNVVRGSVEFASLGIFFVLSHFLQVQLGYSAFVTGLLLMTVIAGALCSSPISETMVDRVDVRWLVIPGLLFTAGGGFWVAHVSSSATWTFFLVPLAIAGLGIGLAEEPATSATQRDVPAELSGAAWSVSYSTYLLGIGLGVAIVSAVWQTELAAHIDGTIVAHGVSGTIGDKAAFAEAVNAALLSCVAAALLGTVTALFLSSNHKPATPES